MLLRMKIVSRIVCAAFVAVALGACSKERGGSEPSSSEPASSSDEPAVEDVVTVPQAAGVDELFGSLDYTPEAPEAGPVYGKLAASAPTAQAGTAQSKSRRIRGLSEYRTRYNTQRKTYADLSFGSEGDKVSGGEAAEGTLTVLDWGPRGEIVAENDFPTFYVVFSQPVRALTALSDPTDTSDVMTITPKIAGQFRWLGTDQLSFEASEPAEPAASYTISVSPTLKSVSGVQVSGDLQFRTVAKGIEISALRPGSTPDKPYSYDSDSGVPLKIAGDFLAFMNVRLSQADFMALASVKIGSEECKFTAKPLFDASVGYGVTFDEKKGTSSVFHVRVLREGGMPADSRVSLLMRRSRDGGSSESSRSYWTLRPFAVESLPSQVGRSSPGEMNPLYIRFNQKPDAAGLAESIRVVKPEGKAIPVKPENVKISGTTLCIANLPIDGYGQMYALEIAPNFKDVWGQPLEPRNLSCQFRVPDAASYLRLTDTGNRMLEWQFPHKVAFDYQNLLPGSGWSLYSVDNPLRSSYVSDSDWSDERAVPFTEVAQNTRHIDAVDLDSKLTNGFGWVAFDTKSVTQYYSPWREEYVKDVDLRRLTVQVTDLGVTARIGVNRVVAMVRSLKTNEPVSGATVTLGWTNQYDDDGFFRTEFASGTTGADGMAVFNLTREQMDDVTSHGDASGSLCLLVRNGDDRAAYCPDSHGYYGRSPTYALKPEERVFMFTDRGVYKPGETVTFRGIDKTQRGGTFESYTGGYEIRLVSTSWRDDTVYGRQNGTASSTGSGGFWGSFDLPSDLEPGGYRISYRRDGHDSYYGDGSVYFTVAYFEPVKIQADVTVPQTTYFAGDSISAQIESTYLAGGALAEADYETTWLRNPVDFQPDTAETRGYRFGPLDRYDAAREVSQSRGKLSADGRANDSCQTTRTDIPVPYRYVVNASVTDVSNQQISSGGSVLVHPSRFYLGLKSSNERGFPKKGDKIDFSVLMVAPDGTKLDGDEAGVMAPGGIEWELSRISWELSNMNGVDDEIYSRYEKKTTVVKSGSEKAAADGTLSFKPEQSGRYVLTVSSKDPFGSPVKTEYGFYVTGSDYYWYGDSSEELSLTADKSQYNPGDTAQVLLNSPLEEGDYLITVEREGIFTQEVRHIASSCTVIDVPIAREFVPVVYVSVSSYSVRTKQPTHQYGEKDTDKPKGYYGMTELFIDPMVRAFSVAVESDKNVYRPGEQATLTLRATRGGKPVADAELTVMAVDRAILDLINYHVPNPIEFFYDRSNFPLCVRGGDSRDLLMDPVTYAIKNLQGGDAEAGEKEKERKEFKPTALFEPVVTTDSQGVAVVSFKVPDNLTTYRVTAFGVKGEQFALQESEIGVRNPINVQSVQPRRLRARDTAECGVLVTNLDNVKHSVKISLAIRKPESNYAADEEEGLITVPGSASVDGQAEQTIEVPSGASYTAYFDVAAESAGTVELVYSVKSDVLNERLVSPILIEKTYVYDTVTMTGSTDDATDAGATEYIQIPAWADDGEGSLEVTLDATRLGMLSTAVRYVFDYPYGCIEQRTSRTLPLVIFGEYLDVFSLNNRVGDVSKVVKAHFAYLRKYQRPDGGFGYWPDSRESSLYVSLRVAMLHAMAKERGYPDSDLKIDIGGLISFIRGEIRRSSYGSYRAFARYVLAMEGVRDDSEVSGIYSEAKDKNLTAMAYCGLYWQVVGSADKARAVVDDLRKWLSISQRSVGIIEPQGGRGWWNYFSTDIERLSMLLKLFSQNDPKDGMVDRLVFSLLSAQSKGYWSSTADTARVLEAVYAYIKARNLDAVKFTAQAELMGIPLVDGKFEGAGAKPVTRTTHFSALSKVEKGKNVPMEIRKKGDGALHYTATMRYAIPDELQNARDEGVRVSLQITDSATGKTVEPKKNSKLIELDSGTTYTARLTVSTSRDRDYLAVRAPVPSGAEILDSAFATTGAGAEITSESVEGTGRGWGHWMTSQTLYDNEAQFFYDWFGKGAATVTFKFRAGRRGVYPVPPAMAECMYEPEVFGRSDGYLFVIK